MAAPTTPYQDTSPSLDIEAPAYRWRGSLGAGQSVTIDLLNASQVVSVYSVTEDVQLSVHSGGVAAGAYSEVPSGGWVSFVEQTKKVIVTNPAAGASVVSIHIALSRIKASELPVLSEANGFDGVQSHSSAVVA